MNTVGVYGGLVVGSAIGGVLASAGGVTAPFWFAFVGSAVFVVLIWGQLRHIAHADEVLARRTVRTPSTVLGRGLSLDRYGAQRSWRRACAER